MDTFEQAIKKASDLTFTELQQEGYKEFKHRVGSLFRTVVQEGLIKKAVIITVHVEPDIATGYNFRRIDSLELDDLLIRGYEIYCYHYYFDENLENPRLEKKQIAFAGDILDFWDSHSVSYEADKPEEENKSAESGKTDEKVDYNDKE